jgi:hypothetical protein
MKGSTSSFDRRYAKNDEVALLYGSPCGIQWPASHNIDFLGGETSTMSPVFSVVSV